MSTAPATLVRVAAVLVALAVAALAAEPASAGAAWGDDLLTVSDLQDGASFFSQNGLVEFSDFEFTAVGFDDAAFDGYFVQPNEDGFRLILGLDDLFGPGSVEMSYTVTAAMPFDINGASIPFLALLEAVGASPLLEVDWSADNGATLFGSSANTDDFPWPGVSTSFEPTASLAVEQIVTLTGGSGFAKVGNAYQVVKSVPEAGTGMLMALAVGGLVASGRRARRQ